MTRFFLLLTALILTPAQVLAQAPERITSPEEREQARQLYERGAMAYQQERWSDCAARFEASFVIVFSPALLYNIGLCYENAASGETAQADLDRAYRAFSRYVRESPDGADVADAQAHLVSVLERIRSLSSVVTPAPAPEEIPPEEEPPEEGHADPVTPDVEVTAASDTSFVAPPATTVESPHTPFRYRWTLVGAGVAALSAALSIGYGASANSKSAEYSRSDNQCLPSLGESDICALRRQGLRHRLLANAFLAVSAVALAGTGLAFTFEFRGMRREDRASVLWARRF